MMKFFNTEVAPYYDRLTQSMRKAGIEVKPMDNTHQIPVYEEVQGLNGMFVSVPINKVNSYRAMGLIADEYIKVVVK